LKANEFCIDTFCLVGDHGAFALADAVYFAKHRGKDDKEPWWIEYSEELLSGHSHRLPAALFPGGALQDPSGSMVPTLVVGDFILVNKFAYESGFAHQTRRSSVSGKPKRGDVMVFRFRRIRRSITSNASSAFRRQDRLR